VKCNAYQISWKKKEKKNNSINSRGGFQGGMVEAEAHGLTVLNMS
jgi:hypothetical protein